MFDETKYTERFAVFQGYGGWMLVHFTDENGMEVVDLDVVMLLAARTSWRRGADVRVVEVEIYDPQRDTYSFLTGLTTDKRIPPHRRDHADGDCRVKVVHHHAINQLGG